ncbi:1308_t:CDS:2, partial [Acaulospora morrowiae]
MSIECPECKALHWIDEKVAGSRHAPIFSTCCAKGKVKPPAIASPPELLEMLLTEESPQAHDFRKRFVFIILYLHLLPWVPKSMNVLSEHKLKLHSIANHPKIIEFFGLCYDTKDDLYFLLMELADDGNLREYMTRNRDYISWLDKIRLA